MTKIAQPKPPYCASCFQKPEQACVDFEAAYDGPVVPGTPEPVPVDDLILCEGCLEEAFALLDPQNLRETINELTNEVLDLMEETSAKDKVIQGFRSTTNELIEFPVKTFPGKPKLEGVPDDIRALITQRRYKRGPTAPTSKKLKDPGNESISPENVSGAAA